MSPIAARNVEATITLTPGTVISRATSGHCSASWAISCSTAMISPSRKAIRRRPASMLSRSSKGSWIWASQARPLTPNRSLIFGRALRQRIKTAEISFFARVRDCTSCWRRANRRRITRVRSSGIHTPVNDPTANSRASVRASRRSVFARA